MAFQSGGSKIKEKKKDAWAKIAYAKICKLSVKDVNIAIA